MSDNTKSNLDWLFSEEKPNYEETNVKLSEGGGEYSNSQIGLWKIGTLWKLQTTTDMDLPALGYEVDGSKAAPFGNLWYFTEANAEKAEAAQKALGLKFQAQHVWHFTMQTSDFLNFNGKDKSVTEVFGAEIAFDVQISSLGALKSRTDFQFLMLPSVIQQVAIVSGFLKQPIYDYSKLPNDPNEDVTPEFKAERHRKLIGTDTDWQNSELGQARVAIWKALGEDKAEAYTISNDPKSKYGVTSDKLKKLLWVVYNPKPTNLWAKMVRVLSPGATSISKSNGKHLTTYICAGIFKSKDEAMNSLPVSEEAEVDDGMPPLPATWKGSTKTEFIDFAKDFFIEKKLKAKPMIVKWITDHAKDWEATSGATAEETQDWIPFFLSN